MIKYRIIRPNGYHEVLTELEANQYAVNNNDALSIEAITFEPEPEPDNRPILLGTDFAAILRSLFLDRSIPLRVALIDKTYSTLYVLENDAQISQIDIDDTIYLLRTQTSQLLTVDEFNSFEALVLQKLNNFKV